MKTTNQSKHEQRRSFVFRYLVVGPMIVMALNGFARPISGRLGLDISVGSAVLMSLMVAAITVGVLWLLFAALTQSNKS